jgi:hypothetical protein
MLGGIGRRSAAQPMFFATIVDAELLEARLT